MSASEDEAFASAEEGESPAVTGASGKSSKSGKASKSKAQDAGKNKPAGKQKGKQQQQQRKSKTKAESKPATDKNEKGSKEKPVEQAPAEASTSTVKSDSKEVVTTNICEKNEKDELKSSSSDPDPESELSGSAVSSKLTVDKTESHDDKKDSETKQKKDTEMRQSPDKSTSGKASETPAKSGGEIRENLSSNTMAKDAALEKPEEQSISRDNGTASKDSGGEDHELKAEKAQAESGGGGWGWGWGSSLLSAATNSLETFSSQVGEGLTTIIDSVESSLGVPDPEELARADSALEHDEDADRAQTVTAQPQEKEGSEEPKADIGEKKKEKEEAEERGAAGTATSGKEEKAQQGSKWLSGWGMSSISDMGKSLVNKSQNLMNTGFEKAETLAAGGLDILETIGKKTYDTLTEHDPGLRRAREFMHLRDEKPSLSSVLREAQDQAEQEAKHNEELVEARKCNFAALFEDNQGLAHLEALEMLSNQSERKVQSLLSAMDEDTLNSIRPQLVEIKDIFQQACDSDDKDHSEEAEHDFSKLVTENLSELHLGTAPDKLNKVQENVRQWIADFYSHEDHNEISDPKEVQQRAVQSLADVTSKAVEQFHKAGELVLMQRDQEKTYTDRAQSLAKLSSVLVTEVDILASKFSQCLNKIGEEKKNTEEVNPMVTSVYLEASNASGYIQDAFQLLLPVLQHAAIQSVL